jgi:hypothetical protein
VQLWIVASTPSAAVQLTPRCRVRAQRWKHPSIIDQALKANSTPWWRGTLTGGAVELATEEQSSDLLGLKATMALVRWQVIVLHSIRWPHHSAHVPHAACATPFAACRGQRLCAAKMLDRVVFKMGAPCPRVTGAAARAEEAVRRGSTCTLPGPVASAAWRAGVSQAGLSRSPGCRALACDVLLAL